MAGLWQCVSMMPCAPKTGWTGDVPAKKNGQTNKIHLSIRFGGASGSRTLAPVSRPIAFRVFEPVGGSWFRSAVIGSCRHFLRLAKVAHQRNLQAKVNHFLRSAVRKASFHTERQELHFRCSSVRCSLEYYSAAVAVPAHSRLPCLNAAFPESREMLRFLLPANRAEREAAMSTFRVNKNVNYTVMSNYHLQDKKLSLKAKGLLSYMLSLPDDWDYSLKGLTTGCKDGLDSVRTAVLELEEHGYVHRQKVRNARGQIIDYDYQVYESPVEDGQAVPDDDNSTPPPSTSSNQKSGVKPCSSPFLDFPNLAEPNLEKATQQNTNKQNTKRQSTNLSGQTAETEDFDQMATRVRAEFREKLEIDILAKRYAPEMLQELLDNIVEMYCCPLKTQYIGKQAQTTKAIRLRLDKLTSQHVEYIFDVMANTTQPIKNIMAYLRTTILNAPTTMEHYYQAQGNWLTAQNRKK